jgi:hypothetical protein
MASALSQSLSGAVRGLVSSRIRLGFLRVLGTAGGGTCLPLVLVLMVVGANSRPLAGQADPSAASQSRRNEVVVGQGVSLRALVPLRLRFVVRDMDADVRRLQMGGIAASRVLAGVMQDRSIRYGADQFAVGDTVRPLLALWSGDDDAVTADGMAADKVPATGLNVAEHLRQKAINRAVLEFRRHGRNVTSNTKAG